MRRFTPAWAGNDNQKARKACVNKGKGLITALLCMLALPLFASGCADKETLEMPVYSELQSITLQEFEKDSAVSREVPLDKKLYGWQSAFPDWTYIDAEDYEKIRKESQMPTRENSIACRLTQTDGTVRLIYVYSDEKYQYIEEAGSIWRNKQHKGIAPRYVSMYNTYQEESFLQAYGQYAADKNFVLLPEYNGSGKAIWLDISSGEVDDWFDRVVPDGFVAKRAEDVRYIILCESAGKDYQGYWYDPKTGAKVADSYDQFYTITIYDLLTGESRIMVEKTNDFASFEDYVEPYFSEME
ncbi:MAG: hypothetical protein GX417_00980 [Clostridiales bacterium]|nr:hypothetical protein [Clostridiales bacterium]